MDERIDFIKLDVEGWELNVLDGLQETIDRCHPPIVFEVNGFTLKWFNYTPNDLIRKLEDQGYHIFGLTNSFVPVNSFTPFPFGVMDCFALRDHHLPIIQKHISLPLNLNQIKEIFKQAYQHGNDDMKGYFTWYNDNFVKGKHNIDIPL